MGIFIHLTISDTIKRDEWEKAYQKSVRLMENLPFVEKMVKECYGSSLVCMTKTVEKEWYGRMGWHTIGDSVSRKTAEDYFMPKDILDSDQESADIESYVDPYMSILPAHTGFDFEDERCSRGIHLWGNKTQAEPYHFYLLAVACMLEHELPGKVAIYGDITKGQCRKASKIASDLLGEKIELPDRCDLQRLYDRVKKMPLHEDEMVDAFTALYMGNQDKDFGAFIRKSFNDGEFKAYWRKVFGCLGIGTIGFSDCLGRYLLWGFRVAELKEYIQFEDEEGNNLAEKFVREVMDTEVFLEKKDCEDVLKIDREIEESYSIYTLLAQVAFIGAKNHRVDRYIPLEELLAELKECVDGYCDVDEIVANYMAERDKKGENENPADCLNEYMHNKRNEVMSERKEWDITTVEELISYEDGDTISDALNKMLLGSFAFYRKVLEEDRYKELLQKSPPHSIRYLIGQNRYFLFMEEEWDRIFTKIEDNIEALERYYPMVRIEPTREEHIELIQAIVLNDELYQYCMENYSKIDSK